MLVLRHTLTALSLAVCLGAGASVASAGATDWVTIPASEYGIGDGFLGNPVACGGTLDTVHMTIATRDDKCGMELEICFRDRCVKAVRNDWGPVESTGRDIDLGPAVSEELGFAGQGVGDVRVRRLGLTDTIPVRPGGPPDPPPPGGGGGGGTADPLKAKHFMTPSGNIRCRTLMRKGRAVGVRCRVLSSDYIAVLRKRARRVTIAPAVANGSLPAVPYGHSWKRGRFRCDSETTGLTCRNMVTKHGFFLSRESTRLF